jgi:hypothetical protein
MLLHLPIVILATPSPTAVSDQVPKFDTARERRYEAGGATVIDRCSRDESTALGQLKTRWRQFGDADKRTCVLDAAALTGRNSPIGDEPMPLVGVELPWENLLSIEQRSVKRFSRPCIRRSRSPWKNGWLNEA